MSWASRPGSSPIWPDRAIYGLDELIRSYLRATHRRRLLVPLPLGGAAYRAMRAGANLAPDRAVGQRTWEEFLADHMAGHTASLAGRS